MTDYPDGSEMNNGKILQYECLLFDLDETLYPLNDEITAACHQSVQEYLVTRLGVEAGNVFKFCTELYNTYGTILTGLVANGYKIDFDDYHNFVNGRLPYHVLRPDPMLRSLLLSMPQRKWVFTNSDQKHTHRVLTTLGLEDCFDGIICFETVTGYPNSKTERSICKYTDDQVKEITTAPVVCKPSPEAIKRAIDITGANPSKTLFFDDSPRNIAAGKVAGLHTVLVGHAPRVEGADYAIESIHSIREALPNIWQEEDVTISRRAIPREAIVVGA